MSGIVVVYAVFASREEADTIGRAMIELRFAACVNLLAPCKSWFRWEGEMTSADEIPAIFKTRAEQVEALISAIVAMHSYDTPAISAWPIAQAWPDYAGWVREETVEAPE